MIERQTVRFGRGDWVAQRWRNGKGASWAIVDGTKPEYEGLQIFRTPITEPAPFSDYAGRNRIFTVVAGSALQLTINGDRCAADLFEPVRFTGEAEVSVALPGGAAEVLNVIYARDRWRQAEPGATGTDVLVIVHAPVAGEGVAADETLVGGVGLLGPPQHGLVQICLEAMT